MGSASAGHGAGELFGPYRAVRELGVGGAGEVFLAERVDFPQRVALKVFAPRFVTARQDAAGELQLLASLDHPHIVRVLQQGVTPAGVRWLAMEYVDGAELLQHCDAVRMGVAGRVALLLQVLDAVEHAHARLVVHGDLKSANVLVGTDGVAKLLDFGAAAAVGGETVALTPAYASPEQRGGGRVTVASDIFSLGQVARQLLAGVPPATPTSELPSRTLTRWINAGAGAEAAARAQIAAEARGTNLKALRSALRGDLDAIVGKALSILPEARYGTAEAMAADLRAWAESRPVSARASTRVERLWKGARRHKVASAMAVLLLVVLLLSSAGVAWKAAEAHRERRQAEARLRELVGLTGALQSELYGSVRTLPGASGPEKLLTDSTAKTLDGLAASGVKDATLRAELADQYAQLAQLELEQAHAGRTAQPAPAAAIAHLQKALALTPEGAKRDERARELAGLQR